MEERDSVFHYTDAAGLLGIIGKMEIWCTHIFYLNDSLEYRIAEQAYRDELTRIAFGSVREGAPPTIQGNDLTPWPADELNLPPLPPLYRRFAHAAIRHLDWFRDYRTNSDFEWTNIDSAPYVACFSANDDDLAQWRGYSGPGPRFLIEFKTSELRELQGMAFAPVIYASEEAAARMRFDFIERICRIAPTFLADGLHTDPWEIHPPQLRDLNHDVIGDNRPLLKHPSFVKEGEYRLYSKRGHFTHEKVEFRIGKSFLVPYVRVALESLTRPITSVMVGPTPHPTEALAAVKRLLWAKGLDFVTVSMSRIPYRDW